MVTHGPAPALSLQRESLTAKLSAIGVSGPWFTSDKLDRIPNTKGAYLLALRLDKSIPLKLSRNQACQVKPGWYLYAGSARGSGGIPARLKRHFRMEKRIHWHIDLLTTQAIEMIALPIANGRECYLVANLLSSSQFKSAVAGFGNTDCRRCDSHLLIPAIP